MAKKEHIPAEIRAHIEAKFDCCVACGTWDADNAAHMVAESNGGAMVKENFVRLCGVCNRIQAQASVAFAGFAPYTLEPATIISRRAYWAKYCGAARGKAKIKPYKPL